MSEAEMKKRDRAKPEGSARGNAAGNGFNRRTLLRAGALAAGMAGIGAGIARAAENVGADAPDWMKTPGRSFSNYGVPSKWQEKVQRIQEALAIENDPSNIFKYEKQLLQENAALTQLSDELDEIERTLE